MNVVYLLGAGASYKAVPVLRGNPEKPGLIDLMKKMIIDFYQKKDPFSIQQIDHDLGYSQYIYQFLEIDGIRLLDNMARYRTPDTLARKIYIINGLDSKEYRDLKHILILFFTLQIFYQILISIAKFIVG